MNKTNEVDDWTEWLDDDDEKREDEFHIDSTKDEAIKKKILQNNLDDIADFLDIGDNKKKKVEETENKVKPKVTEKIITLESTPLNSIKDCETLGEILAGRIRKCKAKSVALERFISIIITASESKLEDKDLLTVSRKLQEMVTQREKKKRYAQINKKKPNEVKNSIKNYEDEVDMIYGDLSYDEDDYEEEVVDEYLENF